MAVVSGKIRHETAAARRRRYLRSYTATHKTPRVHRARNDTCRHAHTYLQASWTRVVDGQEDPKAALPMLENLVTMASPLAMGAFADAYSVWLLGVTVGSLGILSFFCETARCPES